MSKLQEEPQAAQETNQFVRSLMQHRNLVPEEKATRLREAEGKLPLSSEMNPFFLRLRGWSISARARGKEAVWAKDGLLLKEKDAIHLEAETMKKEMK